MNVLFVCTENAGRSQIAEHLFNAAAPDHHRARSAGTRPRDEVYPDVVRSLSRRGVDASAAEPKRLSPDLLDWADRVVTMGCGDECPVTGRPTEDWALDDVRGASTDGVERIVEEIEDRLRRLFRELEPLT